MNPRSALNQTNLSQYTWLIFGLAVCACALLLSQLSPLPVIQAAAGQPDAGGDSLSGQLAILYADGPGGSADNKTLYLLTLANQTQIELDFSAGLPLPYDQMLSLRGRQLQVFGAWQLAPTDDPSFKVSALQTSGPSASDAAAASGAQPWVTLMCKFASLADEPKAPSYFANMYGSAYPLLDHYWREQSYNQMNVSGSQAIAQWVYMPQPRAYYNRLDAKGVVIGVDLNKIAADCTAAADSVVNYTAFVGINMMFNDNLDGYAWGGSHWISLDGTSRIWYMTWEPPWGYRDLTVIAHEMGHGFGLPHSSFNRSSVYDNRWDVMSNTWTDCGRLSDPTYGCLGQHTIAYHKDIEGWLTGKKITVNPGTRQTVSLEQLALPQTGNLLLARVPIYASNMYYTVEVRRNAGYDVKLPGQAVIIHLVNPSQSIPAQLIDPDGNTNTGDAGAQWLPGETFLDAANGISISVDSALSTGFVVTISNALQTVTPGTATYTPSRTPTATLTRTPTRTATPSKTSTKTPTPRPTIDPALLTHHIFLPSTQR